VIAETLEEIDETSVLLDWDEQDSDPFAPPPPPLSFPEVREDTVKAMGGPPSDPELAMATQLVRGHANVEVPGRWSKNEDLMSDIIVLPELMPLSDYHFVPCKHECIPLKQARHVMEE